MTNDQTRPPGRPRSETTRLAVLHAGAKLLAEEPYARISIERIASEAKVGKQSIYRWWNSKADVLLEAFTALTLGELPEIAKAADAEDGIVSQLRFFVDSSTRPTVVKTLRGLIAEAQLDPEFRAKFHAALVGPCRDLMRAVIKTGITKGEFRADVDIETVLDFIHGAFWYRLLSGTEGPLDDAFAKSIVTAVRPLLAKL